LLAAEAVDEDVGRFTTAEFGAESVRVGRVRGKDAVRFAGETSGGFPGGNQGGDIPSGFAKKIRAPFTGVATAGEEDARS
jgi:hypothetical protein